MVVNMTFEEVMSIIHSPDLLFDEHFVFYVMKETSKSPDDKAWILVPHEVEYRDTYDLVCSVFEGPRVRFWQHLVDDNPVVRKYLEWKKSITDYSQNYEVPAKCPVGDDHQMFAHWARVRQVGTTFDRMGFAVDYEAEVPAVYCSHPECVTYYLDHVSSIVIEEALDESRKRSELKSL